jgi:hypothetical protein
MSLNLIIPQFASILRFHSRDIYKSDYQMTAINQGVLIKDLIEASMFELDAKTRTTLNSMRVEVFPL